MQIESKIELSTHDCIWWPIMHAFSWSLRRRISNRLIGLQAGVAFKLDKKNEMAQARCRSNSKILQSFWGKLKFSCYFYSLSPWTDSKVIVELSNPCLIILPLKLLYYSAITLLESIGIRHPQTIQHMTRLLLLLTKALRHVLLGMVLVQRVASTIVS